MAISAWLSATIEWLALAGISLGLGTIRHRLAQAQGNLATQVVELGGGQARPDVIEEPAGQEEVEGEGVGPGVREEKRRAARKKRAARKRRARDRRMLGYRGEVKESLASVLGAMDEVLERM